MGVQNSDIEDGNTSHQNIFQQSMPPEASWSPDNVTSKGPPGSGPRSRNGCWTCRTKKVKCNEVRPKCGRCVRLRLLCDYVPRMRQKSVKALVKQLSGRQWTPTSPSVLLLEFRNSASSLNLTCSDHEAIRYYRTTFSKLHHTKHPDYGTYAIIFSIAEREPLVMRAVLALGSREIEYRKRGLVQPPMGAGTVSPLHHYSAALRMLAAAVDGTQGPDGRLVDLDAILAAIFLMLWYEQKFGDGSCSGIAHHLTGAATVLRHRCRNEAFKKAIQDPQSQRKMLPLIRMRDATQDGDTLLSLFGARMIVQMCLYDSLAASNDFGGRLIEFMVDHQGRSAAAHAGGPDWLCRYSYSLYRVMWGDDYPQEELLDDLSNRTVFALIAVDAQLRFMVAGLKSLPLEEAQLKLAELEYLFHAADNQFQEVTGIADNLSVTLDSSALADNIRHAVPRYYGTKIDLTRAVRQLGLTWNCEWPTEEYVGAIMRLFMQTVRLRGDEGLLIMPSTLFSAALETCDASRRQWFITKLQSLSEYGCNYARAYKLLVRAMAARAKAGVVASCPLTHEEVARSLISETGGLESFLI